MAEEIAELADDIGFPVEASPTLHQRKLCFELEFLDITLKGCFRLKATGRQIDIDHPSTTDAL
jgi:hypothetical protein